MADPQQSLSFGDWLAAAVGSMIVGIGGAMAWFNGEKKALRTKMHDIQSDMVAWNLKHAAQAQTQAVMAEKFIHVDAKLGDIKGDCEKLDRKMDDLYRLVQTKT